MFATILVIGCCFGMAAGVFLGLPAFALGSALAVGALLVLEIAVGSGFGETALRLLALAVSLQIAYAIGLVARANVPALRKRNGARRGGSAEREAGRRDR
ncbi:hypothetical protein [Salinarimonas sp.]|uniref:hypothetical protein n=1 Tax=Salinarimonas sp. TaxID=2766526 RepID=UPI0032D8E0DF